jgi:hypothetical protein
MEVVLPPEVQLPSLRIAVHEGLTSDENVILRLKELEALDGERLKSQQKLEVYWARMYRAYDKLTGLKAFTKGELVLVLRRPIIIGKRAKGKFDSNQRVPEQSWIA